MRVLKYFLGFSIPLFCYFSLGADSLLSWSTVIFAFVAIPVLDELLPEDEGWTEVGEKYWLLYDILLYANIVLVYGLVIKAGIEWATPSINYVYRVGEILGLGIMLGANGLNVSHELGHRIGLFEKLSSAILQIPSFYTHFRLEHNMGHHSRVATPEDPATSRKNEILYFFWFRSIFYSFIAAWQKQIHLLKKQNFFGFKNELLWSLFAQLVYIALVIYYFKEVSIAIFAAGFVSILLLETINYIEHYGIFRTQIAKGKYESVKPMHSWNSNHRVGRMVLYELPLHSHHHHKHKVKYQNLQSVNNSPQLPFGYPASILIALVPPLWFLIMNKKIR